MNRSPTFEDQDGGAPGLVLADDLVRLLGEAVRDEEGAADHLAGVEGGTVPAVRGHGDGQEPRDHLLPGLPEAEAVLLPTAKKPVVLPHRGGVRDRPDGPALGLSRTDLERKRVSLVNWIEILYNNI